MATWETFTSRVIIGARLEAMTALRVGAGGTDAAQPASSDLPVLIGPNDQPFIPGSSLRGVVRSHVERIVRTLEPRPEDGNFAGRGACDPVAEAQWCITKDQMDEWRNTAREHRRNGEDADLWMARQVWERSCRVCRVFGSAWLASRVRIADLHPDKTKPIRIERRDGVAIHREKETVQHKYDFETVPVGSTFVLCITAENLSPAEHGLLWMGLRELSDGAVLLGGFKGRGLGRVQLAKPTIQGVESANRAALRSYLLDGRLSDMLAEADTWLQALWAELEAA